MLSATGKYTIPTPEDEPNRAIAYLYSKGRAKDQAEENLIRKARAIAINYGAPGVLPMNDERLRNEIDGMKIKPILARKIQIGKGTAVEVTVQATRPARWNNLPPPGTTIPPPFTSVIIDTLGLGVTRRESPKILREDGSEVWGTVKADPDQVADGIVVYARTIGDARSNARAGSNPLVIRACARGASVHQCDLVLSSADAENLLSENWKAGFLFDFAVIFVVD
jgi:hypothetical protein